MVRRKSEKKKKTSRSSGTQKGYFKRTVVGLTLLALLVVVSGFLAHYLMWHKQPLQPAEEPIAHKAPVFEIYPKEKISPHKPTPKPEACLPEKLPRVAIIIDDLGYDSVIAEKFLSLGAVFTFSVLPYSPFQEKIARTAHIKGFEIMLHLPMEPLGYPSIDPGPGTLLTSMTQDQLISQLNKNLDAVPFITGVNNHMGSKMTANSAQMYQILSVLEKRGLFFIDSVTTPESLSKPSARLLQIPFAQRDVFLDHIEDADFIRKQIELLIRIAERYGKATGIAHPHQVTYEVFRDMLPGLQERVLLVPASEVVDIIS